MGFIDKLRNKIQLGQGRGKREADQAAGDPYLEARGEGERAGGAAPQAGEQAKNAGKNARDAFQ